MCPQLGFSFGIYLKHFPCEKFPPISKGHIIVSARGHGAGGPHCQLASVIGTPRTTAVHAQHSLFTSHQGPCRFCQGIRALPPTIPGANSAVTKWQRMCRNCKRLKADFELSSSWCPWWCLGSMLLTERIGNRFSSLWGCQ